MPYQSRVHKEFFHVQLNFQLTFVLHLTQIHELFMANDLMLIVSKCKEDMRFMITKCRVNYFELR